MPTCAATRSRPPAEIRGRAHCLPRSAGQVRRKVAVPQLRAGKARFAGRRAAPAPAPRRRPAAAAIALACHSAPAAGGPSGHPPQRRAAPPAAPASGDRKSSRCRSADTAADAMRDTAPPRCRLASRSPLGGCSTVQSREYLGFLRFRRRRSISGSSDAQEAGAAAGIQGVGDAAHQLAGAASASAGPGFSPAVPWPTPSMPRRATAAIPSAHRSRDRPRGMAHQRRPDAVRRRRRRRQRGRRGHRQGRRARVRCRRQAAHGRRAVRRSRRARRAWPTASSSCSRRRPRAAR